MEKIDFILERYGPLYRRGVQTEFSVEKRGIQFTQGRGKSAKEKKVKRGEAFRVGRVDDVVILSMRGEWPKECFAKWIREGRPSGGPEQFLDDQMKETMFKEAFEGMFSFEEIEGQWQRISEREV